MKIQVEKGHYDFSEYVGKGRWISYYHQIDEILKKDCKEVLIIGIGDNIIKYVLESFGKKVTTFDFDSNLTPDIVGDVTEIDEIVTNKYDLVICCQVLEHIPFEKFDNIIDKLKNITKKSLILSLPDHCTYMKFCFRFICFKECNLVLRIPIFWQRKFRIDVEGYNEHYWELDCATVSKKMVRNVIKKYFLIEREFADKDHLTHYFFICNIK